MLNDAPSPAAGLPRPAHPSTRAGRGRERARRERALRDPAAGCRTGGAAVTQEWVQPGGHHRGGSSAGQRVLAHRASSVYPRVLSWFAQQRLAWHDDAAWLDGARLDAPMVEDFRAGCPLTLPAHVRACAPPRMCLAVGLPGRARRRSPHADELRPYQATYNGIWHGMTVAVSNLHARPRRAARTGPTPHASEPRRASGRMASGIFPPLQVSVVQVTGTECGWLPRRSYRLPRAGMLPKERLAVSATTALQRHQSPTGHAQSILPLTPWSAGRCLGTARAHG